jgi:hypothetical protein
MVSSMWYILLFSLGFLAGLGAAFAAFLVTRMRREAPPAGPELVERLGRLDARRFLTVAE